jgi:proteasome beta subunit
MLDRRGDRHAGDLAALLAPAGEVSGWKPDLRNAGLRQKASAEEPDLRPVVEGTTVLAVKHNAGVLNLGDRRATAANAVMFDRAEKIIALDDYTLLAVSGAYAAAMEIARYLQQSFAYYRRSQLQEISLEGKISEISRAVAGALPLALGGSGGVLPVLSAYDTKADEGRIFFYDGLGARFETAEFGAAGSGSERIRGVFDYIVQTKKPFHQMPLDEALAEGLRLLDIAASLDTATGGLDRVLPLAMTVSAEGIERLGDDRIRAVLATESSAPC